MNGKLLLALACASSLAACALTEDKISLTHSAPQGVALVPGAETAPITVVVTDARTLDRTRVGSKINGYGAELAAIRPDREVPTIVKEAVEKELVARGFKEAADGRQVRVQVDTFYSSFQSGMLAGRAGADVDLTISVVTKNGRVIFNRKISGHGLKQNVQLASGENARDVLEQALDDAMNKLTIAPGFMDALTVAL